MLILARWKYNKVPAAQVLLFIWENHVVHFGWNGRLATVDLIHINYLAGMRYWVRRISVSIM
jgi:hypothetical protein